MAGHDRIRSTEASGICGKGAAPLSGCVAGENDSLPGLVLDRYDGTLVLKLYTAAWLPHLPGLTQTGHPAGRVFGSIPGDGISEVDFEVPPPRQL